MSSATTLIVGGGPAGLAIAIALRRAGREAVVIERTDYSHRREIDTLAPAAAPVLRTLGVGEDLLSRCSAPCRGIRAAWDTADLAEQTFFTHPWGDGRHVLRGRFDAELAGLAERLGVAVWRNCGVVDLRRAGDHWQVDLRRASASVDLTVGHLVDATGRAAKLARHLGSRRLTYDRLIALTGQLATRSNAGTMLYLEATQGGWLYSLPTDVHRAMVCFVTDADLLPRDAGPDDAWRAALAHAPRTRARLKAAALDAPLTFRAAAVGRLASVAGPGWLAVGDAAVSLDPLCGAGLAEALRGGLAAAQAIIVGDPDAYARAEYDRFAAHMVQRTSHYTRVARFRDALFWRRRAPIGRRPDAVALDPMTRIVADRVAGGSAAGARVEGFMARQDIACLRRLCATPTEAHRVVQQFRTARASQADDLAAILALQVLVEDHAIRRL